MSGDSAAGEQGLHPAQLFHVGVVAGDFDSAMAEMSANLGLAWCGGKPAHSTLVVFGEERQLEMRIAHSLQGPPHVELIQAVPDTPWAAPSAGVHHVCYWSDDAAAICARLEATGNRRILGASGTSTGYFQSPSGMIIEIIDRPLYDRLAGWIGKEAARVQSGVV